MLIRWFDVDTLVKWYKCHANNDIRCVIPSDMHLKPLNRYEDGVIMEVVLEKFVKYFRAVLHHNQGFHSASQVL